MGLRDQTQAEWVQLLRLMMLLKKFLQNIQCKYYNLNLLMLFYDEEDGFSEENF